MEQAKSFAAKAKLYASENKKKSAGIAITIVAIIAVIVVGTLVAKKKINIDLGKLKLGKSKAVPTQTKEKLEAANGEETEDNNSTEIQMENEELAESINRTVPPQIGSGGSDTR